MSELTYSDFIDKGLTQRSFTCKACGGFKFMQVPQFNVNDIAICEECYQNRPTLDLRNFGAVPNKPGLRETLMSYWRAEYENYVTFKEWIKINGGEGSDAEEKVQHQLIKYVPDAWKHHYFKTTGEHWQ